MDAKLEQSDFDYGVAFLRERLGLIKKAAIAGCGVNEAHVVERVFDAVISRALQAQQPEAVLDPNAGTPYALTDSELLAEFVRLSREYKPVGQWPGERVCRAIERLLNPGLRDFISEADRAPLRGHNGRGGDADQPLPPLKPTQPEAQGEAEDFHDILYGAKLKILLDPESDSSVVRGCVAATFGSNDGLEIMLHAVDAGGNVVKLYTAAPKPVEGVTDAMVERAINAYDEATGEGWQLPCMKGMRAALESVLTAAHQQEAGRG